MPEEEREGTRPGRYPRVIMHREIVRDVVHPESGVATRRTLDASSPIVVQRDDDPPTDKERRIGSILTMPAGDDRQEIVSRRDPLSVADEEDDPDQAVASVEVVEYVHDLDTGRTSIRRHRNLDRQSAAQLLREAETPQNTAGMAAPAEQTDVAGDTAEIIHPEPAPSPRRRVLGGIIRDKAASGLMAAPAEQADVTADTSDTAEIIHPEPAPSPRRKVLGGIIRDKTASGLDAVAGGLEGISRGRTQAREIREAHQRVALAQQAAAAAERQRRDALGSAGARSESLRGFAARLRGDQPAEVEKSESQRRAEARLEEAQQSLAALRDGAGSGFAHRLGAATAGGRQPAQQGRKTAQGGQGGGLDLKAIIKAIGDAGAPARPARSGGPKYPKGSRGKGKGKGKATARGGQVTITLNLQQPDKEGPKTTGRRRADEDWWGI